MMGPHGKARMRAATKTCATFLPQGRTAARSGMTVITEHAIGFLPLQAPVEPSDFATAYRASIDGPSLLFSVVLKKLLKTVKFQ